MGITNADQYGDHVTDSTRELPLFPLGVVHFPGQPLDLQVFEPRYLALLEDLADQKAQEFGVVAITSGHEVGRDNLHAIAEAGCAVQIEHSRRVGGRVMLRAVGTWRFDHIQVLERNTPYLTAVVRPLPDEDTGQDDIAGLRSALFTYADAAELQLNTIPADPHLFEWWVAAGGPFTQAERVQVLAASRADRVERLTAWLRREAALLQGTGSIPFDRDPRQSLN